MFPAFRQSLRGLASNPVRTVLTTLGIVIGISTVILVLSAGAGFRSLVTSQVNALGSNTLFVSTRVPPTTKSRAQKFSAGVGGGVTGIVINTFKTRDLDDIRRLPNVVDAYGMVTGQAEASEGNHQKSVIYYGAGAERFRIDQHTLQEGRFYTPAEDAGAAQVIILGSDLAKDLFGQNEPVGRLVRLGTLNFQVIGVYAPQGGLAFGGTADSSAYIPLATAQKKMLGIDYLSVGIVQMRDTSLGDATAAEIRSTLERNHRITDPAKDDFEVQTQTQALDTFNVIFSGITALLIAIAAISLLVGGVGIMNIMYVVVTERTAEIGLKKAVGATRGAILREFLLEAVLLTVLGGSLGIAWGALLGWIVAAVARANQLAWTFAVPPSAILLGVGVSAAIGIVFGVLPARNAARLDPVEALRYE